MSASAWKWSADSVWRSVNVAWAGHCKAAGDCGHVIAMSVLVLNLRKIQCALLRMLTYLLEILAQNKNWAFVQWTLVRPLETGVVGHKSYILLFSYSSIFRVQMKFYCF